MIDMETRKRLAQEIEAQGRDMKEVSLSAGLGETYVRDVLKRGRGKVENIFKVVEALGKPRNWILEGAVDEIWTVKWPEVQSREKKGDAVPYPHMLPKFEKISRLGNKADETVIIPSLADQARVMSRRNERAEGVKLGSPLPVLGAARAGDDGKLIYNGETIEWVPRPPMLEGVDGAYATYVAGDSMKPRFKEGEKVWVHPRRMAKSGDDVVVQLTPKEDGEPPEGYIKEFRRWSGPHLVLYQHNPPGEFSLSRDEVFSVHVIIGSLYV